MNQRQLEILNSISKLEILTRSQIQKLHNTKSVRNTNYVVNKLGPYLSSIRLHENAYYLNKRGMELVGMDKQFKYSSQINHKLLRNDAYIHFEPKEWFPEAEFKIGELTIKPDAFFKTRDKKYHFLEIDNLQKWHVNVRKLENYAKIKQSGAFQRKYGHFPLVIFVTTFPGRKERFLKLANTLDLTIQVYMEEEVKA